MEKPKNTKEARKEPAPPVSAAAPKTETVEKRETRSRHEKKRREEMNEVLTEMMHLLPGDVQKDAFKLKRSDQKPKRPDKCFIIGNAVEFIKKNTKQPSILSDPLVRDIFDISNCFLITMQNFIIAGINGEYRSIFDVEKNRMVGKDIRCFLDFESATKLSFLTFNPTHPLLNLRSFMAKSMTCRTKINDQNPSEMTLVCVPDDVLPLPPTVVPPVRKIPSCEVDRPILAALLRRKDPVPAPVIQIQKDEGALGTERGPMRVDTRNLTISTVQTTPVHSDTASTSSCSFLSPSSTSSNAIHPVLHQKSTPRKQKSEQGKRKRLRSVNVIVESYSLDDAEPKPKVVKAAGNEGNVTSLPAPLPTVLPESIPAPLAIPTTSFIPIPQGNLTANPYDVLAPGYKDIWLRLQSERLLLEERIVAKEGELKSLMLTACSLPHYIPQLSIPQYTFPQAPLNLVSAENP